MKERALSVTQASLCVPKPSTWTITWSEQNQLSVSRQRKNGEIKSVSGGSQGSGKLQALSVLWYETWWFCVGKRPKSITGWRKSVLTPILKMPKCQRSPVEPDGIITLWHPQKAFLYSQHVLPWEYTFHIVAPPVVTYTGSVWYVNQKNRFQNY